MNLPLPVLIIFVASTAFLVIGAIGFASRRVAVTVLALRVVAIAIPLVIGTIRWPYFQGRYMFPLTVGLPVVAGLGVGEGLRGGRCRAGCCGCCSRSWPSPKSSRSPSRCGGS